MPNDLVIGPFTVRTGIREYFIHRNERSLTVHPGTAEDAVGVVLDAMKIESFPVLPASLERGAYIVRFSPVRTMVLSQRNDLSSGVGCTFEEGDSLIYCLKSGLDLWISEDKALRGGGAQAVPVSSLPDVPFDTGH